MKVSFWGVRGSIPSPITNTQLRKKISAIIKRIKPNDIISKGSRERFLNQLPRDVFGTVGGNTTCIEINAVNTPLIIVDAGSGIRELSIDIEKRKKKPSEFHVFLTHFHWDHIQGLPFVIQGFSKENSFFFYSPIQGFSNFLRQQMKAPFFPISMDKMDAKIEFVELNNNKSFFLGDTQISWRQMTHPSGSYAYSFKDLTKKMIFATDAEIGPLDFKRSSENKRFFKDTDLLILDSQYDVEDAIEKNNWGHTSNTVAVDFASAWGVRKLVLFHHEPLYNDEEINDMLIKSIQYMRERGNSSLSIDTAQEGMMIDI